MLSRTAFTARAVALRTRMFSTASIVSRKKHDPSIDPPKRPGSAYQLWYIQKVKDLKKPDEKLNVREAAKQLAEQWKSVAESEKQKLEQAAQKAKEEWHEAVASWYAALAPGQLKEINASRKAEGKSALKDPNAVKRPLSAYMRFVKDVRSQIDAEQEGAGLERARKVASEAGKRWKALSEREQEEYRAAYQAEKEEYDLKTGKT